MSETKINGCFCNEIVKNTPRYGIKKGFKPPKFENNTRKGFVVSWSDDNTKEQELLTKIAEHSRIFVLPEIEPLNGE